jgi:hypothetical protein
MGISDEVVKKWVAGHQVHSETIFVFNLRNVGYYL